MIVFDIETLPDPVFGGPEPDRVKVPANYKDPEKINAFRQEHADKEWRSRAISPVTGKICCISAAILSPELGEPEVHNWFDARETDLLWGFQEWILSLEPDMDAGVHVPQMPLAAWRGTSFDFAFVAYRAARAGHRYLARRALAPKYGSKNHIDPSLLACFSTSKFRDVCRSLGVEHPSPDGGSKVLDQVLAGRMDQVVSHCHDDVVALWHVCRKLTQGGLL